MSADQSEITFDNKPTNARSQQGLQMNSYERNRKQQLLKHPLTYNYILTIYQLD